MYLTILRAAAVAVLLQFPALAAAGGEPPSTEEMWRMIQSQQREIEALKRRLQATEHKTEATAAAVDEAQTTAGTKASWTENTQVGGYGELQYKNLNGKGGADDDKEIDFHRFVLFFGHQFNERTRLFSELEVEHAVSEDGAPGAVELEQAYVEFDVNDRLTAKGGLFLLPVGILNETHEPPTYYGVRRNPVEHDIVPTTWWAGGAGLHGELAPGLSFDVALHEGMKASAADGYEVREARQETAEAAADDLAGTVRLKWTGFPGLELAGSYQHQTDITQGTDSAAGKADFYELHGIWSKGPFGLRALYARWNLDGSGPRAIGADKQDGFYIEPSYRLTDQFGIFARFNQWDNAAGSSSDSQKKQWNVGANWWPHPDVVIKADYQAQDNEDDQDQDGVNLGIGYQF